MSEVFTEAEVLEVVKDNGFSISFDGGKTVLVGLPPYAEDEPVAWEISWYGEFEVDSLGRPLVEGSAKLASYVSRLLFHNRWQKIFK